MKRRIRIPRRGRIRAVLVVLSVLAFLAAFREVTIRRDEVLFRIQSCVEEVVRDNPRFTFREAWLLCVDEETQSEM